MNESESVLRAVAAQRYPALWRDWKPRAEAEARRWLVKTLLLLCGLALGGAALWLKANVAWQFVGK